MAFAETAALIGSLELQDKFSKNVEKYERSLGSMERKTTSTFSKIGSEAQRGLGQLASNLTHVAALGAGLAVTGLVFSIRAASNLEESLSKVNVVFGESADEIDAWASTAATAFGSSRQQALEAAGTFGNLFQAFGLGRDQSAEMSTSLVELAADLASFNNTSVDDALLALRSGLSGETEPLKRYGVALSEARLKQEALRLGIISTTKTALTPAQKAQASYSLILHDTALAQGDFARTSDGLANQQRILRAQLQDTAATIGTALLPKITELVTKFSSFLTDHQDDIAQIAEQLPAAFDKLVEFGSNLPWDAIGSAFELMGTGSRALLDAFLGLPPWVQTAVLTSWGLNKLTGGALGNIVSTLASGLIKGVLGIQAAQVNIQAANVTGVGGVAGGAPVAAAGGGAAATAAGIARSLVAIGAFTAIATVIGEVVAQNVTRPLDPVQFDFNTVAGASGEFTTAGQANEFAQALADELDMPLDQVQQKIVAAITIRGLTFDQAVHQLRDDLAPVFHEVSETGKKNLPYLQSLPRIQNITKEEADRTRRLIGAGFSSAEAAEARSREQRAREATAALQAQSAAQVKLQQIADKDFSPTVRVSVVSNVTISEIQRKITSQQIAVGTGPQEF